MFSANVFKAYDIRGLAETELSADFAYYLGRSFVLFLRSRDLIKNNQKIVVGYDMRLTSRPYSEALIKGLNTENVNVVNIGLVSTPLFNFACAHYPEHAGGIMVTASHNPAEYNGFKITLNNGLPVGENSGMNEIKELVLKLFGEPSKKTLLGNAMFEQKNILPDYLEHIFKLVKPAEIKPLKIIVDAGNGMAKASLPAMLQSLPVEAEYLFLEPDGSFPNHEANPLKVSTLQDLQRKVVETKSDFGFALDGDADRIGLVNEKGEVVGASFVGALLGLEVLRDHPDGHMLYDVRSSQIVPEVWQAQGATAEMCKVGHANIKKSMKEKDVIFASELSLHLYYHEIYDLESPDLSLLYILRLLSREQKPLSEIVKPLQKYFHSGEINFTLKDKNKVITAVETQFKSEATQISYIDGLWMHFDWGWISMRSSNTEPVLRLNLEAKDEQTMREKIKLVSQIINVA